MLIALLQKSAPDNLDFMVFLLVLLGFLTILYLFNNLIDWLRSKPWKRSIPPEDGLPEGEPQDVIDPKPEPHDRSDKYQIEGSLILKQI